MANPGPASSTTEHPIGGGGGPAYLGVSGGNIGFYQDPFGGGAVPQRRSAVQLPVTVSSVAGLLINYTSSSQSAPQITAQNISSTAVTFTGAPMVSTADVLIVNKATPIAQYGIANVRVNFSSQASNLASIVMHHANFSVSGVSTVTPAGDLYQFTAFRGAIVNSVTLSPTIVNANTTVEQQFAVSGVAPGMIVAVNKPTDQAELGIGGTRVVSNNVLGITFINNGNTAITPTSNEVYQYAALNGAVASVPMFVAGVYFGSAAPVITVTGAQLTPSPVTVTGINTSDVVLGTGQGILPPVQGLALLSARVSASVANTMHFTFFNATQAAVTALSTDTIMVPILRPAMQAPCTLYSATVPSTTIGPNTCTEIGVTVTGLTVSSNVFVSKPTFTTGVGIVGYRVSNAATSVVGITFGNPTSASVVIPTETYTVAQFLPVLGTGHYAEQLVSPLSVQGIALTNEIQATLAGMDLFQGF